MIERFYPVPVQAVNGIANITELGLYVKMTMILDIMKRDPLPCRSSIKGMIRKRCCLCGKSFDKQWKALKDHGWLKIVCIRTDDKDYPFVYHYELRTEPDLLTPPIRYLSDSQAQEYLKQPIRQIG